MANFEKAEGSQWSHDPTVAAAKSCNLCVRVLTDMLGSAGINVDPGAGTARQRFNAVIRQLEENLSSPNREKVRRAALDLKIFDPSLLDRKEDLADAVLQEVEEAAKERRKRAIEIDDLSPNEYKEELYEIIEELREDEDVVVEARKIFRNVLRKLQKSGRLRGRINVVWSNFERMKEYLIELIEVGQGVRLYGVGRYIDTMKILIEGRAH